VNTVIFDYGAGNIHSLAKAVAGGAAVRVERDPLRALEGDVLVLPGVGAFAPAAAALAPARADMASAVRNGHRCFGICLGLLLLFETSE
jgi:glutamine amidotransferase